MSEHNESRARSDVLDRASMSLGNAWGIAYLVWGQVAEPEEEVPADLASVAGTLRYVAEVVDAVAIDLAATKSAASAAVDRAGSVCRVVRSECVIEIPGAGGFGFHFNDDITTWSLLGLCDAIQRAKAAVDKANEDECRLRLESMKGAHHVYG